MICLPSDLPALFAGSEPPPGATISDAAAEAVARLLWSRAETELGLAAEQTNNQRMENQSDGEP